MTAQLLPGNRITLLETGAAYFPALIAAIDSALHEIHLESYIFEHDATGILVASALAAAAMRGVKVRVMVDGFGGRGFERNTAPQLLAAGVEVMLFRRELGFFKIRRHRLRRLHRKLSIFDQKLAFVGGINIIDDMHTPKQIPPRFDYAVSVEGPLVAPIQEAVNELWDLMSWANFKHRPHPHYPKPTPSQPAGNVHAAFVLRDNLRHRKDIEHAYLAGIARARHDVIIANAYFLPGKQFRDALIEASRLGVRVTLLLQGRVEYWLLHHACRALYPHLLASGIHIVEYRKSFLHAKVAVMDDGWATVGSSNIDPFSLLLAREANVIVRDRAFTAELRDSLMRAIRDGGVALTREDWQRQPRLARLVSWAAYGLVRLLIGLAGYAKQH
ncbi:MAG TPA: cardiolipin synthase ClsB [Rhodocyclaceae bacterium]|nr:cardiolipin synthase ClsB [Rhodocyclaceae bacterium]